MCKFSFQTMAIHAHEEAGHCWQSDKLTPLYERAARTAPCKKPICFASLVITPASLTHAYMCPAAQLALLVRFTRLWRKSNSRYIRLHACWRRFVKTERGTSKLPVHACQFPRGKLGQDHIRAIVPVTNLDTDYYYRCVLAPRNVVYTLDPAEGLAKQF